MIRILILMVLSAGTLRAQVDPDSVRARNECRLASQVIETGQPAPHMDWALSTIRSCGPDGAAALARAVLAHRTSTDSAVMGRLTRPTQYMVDGEIFDVAYRVASDPDASTVARVFAVRTLIWTLAPGRDLTYDDLTGVGGQGNCAGGFSTHIDPEPGSPLPEDHEQRIRDLAVRLTEGDAAPPEVRSAAVCLRIAVDPG